MDGFIYLPIPTMTLCFGLRVLCLLYKPSTLSCSRSLRLQRDLRRYIKLAIKAKISDRKLLNPFFTLLIFISDLEPSAFFLQLPTVSRIQKLEFLILILYIKKTLYTCQTRFSHKPTKHTGFLYFCYSRAH